MLNTYKMYCVAYGSGLQDVSAAQQISDKQMFAHFPHSVPDDKIYIKQLLADMRNIFARRLLLVCIWPAWMELNEKILKRAKQTGNHNKGLNAMTNKATDCVRDRERVHAQGHHSIAFQQ